MRLFGSVVVMFALASFSFQGSAKEWSFRQESVEWRKFLLPTKELEIPNVERRFRNLLSSRDPTATRIFQVILMDRPESLSLTESGYNDISYSLWKLLFADYQNAIPPFAELLAIGKDAAMRIRDGQGHVSLKVIEGANPYNIQACGDRLSVVHLAIGRADTIIGDNAAQTLVYLSFFLVANAPVDEKIARCVLKELRKRTSESNVNVYVRNDPWFLQHSDYPVVCPFLAEVRPPTQQEYEGGIEWECNSRGANVTCSGGRHRFQFGPTQN